jgi:formylglycine-generating enzyme required for sulfatase activity
MGAQSSDPAGPNFDPEAHENESPVHEVELSPFFLSKYEMTQGQWERFVGRNPSQFGPQRYESKWERAGNGWSALHPVEQVRWSDCVETLGRLGLALPSEAQWEYAARAGTSTPWWTGPDHASLANAGNVADSYGKVQGNETWSMWDEDIDDGSTVHAEVGSYRPNGFGLHDVVGNVLEWCEDDCFGGFYRESARLDPVARLPGSTERVIRGGDFNNTASRARSSARAQGSPEDHTSSLGVRPARALRS